MAGVLFVTVLGGVAVIDVGMLMNTRRDSQNDVDKIALAGALELTLDPATASADTDDALDQAIAWAQGNGLQIQSETRSGNQSVADLQGGGTLTLTVVAANECYDTDSTQGAVGVRAHLTERPAPTFLAGFVGLNSLGTGASALACAGRPMDQFGFLPFALPQFVDDPNGDFIFDPNAGDWGEFVPVTPGTGDYVLSDCFEWNATEGRAEPILGYRCEVVIDPSQSDSGKFSQLSLSTNGGNCPDHGQADAYRQNIRFGAQVRCRIGDAVSADPGGNTGQTVQGFNGQGNSEGRFTGASGIVPDGSCEDTYAAGQAAFDAANNAFNTWLAGQNPGQPTLRDPESPSLNDDIDDMFEIWELDDPSDPAKGLIPRDCGGGATSARNVALIIIGAVAEEDGYSECNGPKCYRVRDFARVYIEGCMAPGGSGNQYDATCDLNGQPLTVLARFIEQVGVTDSELGLESTFGQIEVVLKE